MIEKIKAEFTPEVRKWLYGIASAVSAALGVFGVLDAQKLAAILFVISAVLWMANQNTPTVAKVSKGAYDISSLPEDGTFDPDVDYLGRDS